MEELAKGFAKVIRQMLVNQTLLLAGVASMQSDERVRAGLLKEADNTTYYIKLIDDERSKEGF